jgi:hypothetical protein
MTPEEKERIDYEIKVKKEQFDYELQAVLKAKEAESNGCLSDILWGFFMAVVFFAIVISCNS